MLPPFIIDQIRRREDEVRRKKEQEQPRLELPIGIYHPAPKPTSKEEKEVERGVVILELL